MWFTPLRNIPTWMSLSLAMKERYNERARFFFPIPKKTAKHSSPVLAKPAAVWRQKLTRAIGRRNASSRGKRYIKLEERDVYEPEYRSPFCRMLIFYGAYRNRKRPHAVDENCTDLKKKSSQPGYLKSLSLNDEWLTAYSNNNVDVNSMCGSVVVAQ